MTGPDDALDPTRIAALFVDSVGDATRAGQLTALLYRQLHAMAQRAMQREAPDHTLQPTALVHEAWERLVGSGVSLHDRCHFVALMATQMRRVLIDHAKGRRRDKRGGAFCHVSLDDVGTVAAGSDADVLELDDVLRALGRVDARKERVVEMHYFGGMTQTEIAEALAVSPATVDRELRLARAWIRVRLDAADDAPLLDSD